MLCNVKYYNQLLLVCNEQGVLSACAIIGRSLHVEHEDTKVINLHQNTTAMSPNIFSIWQYHS